MSPAEVAIAWLLAQPGVTAPIVGATKVGHLVFDAYGHGPLARARGGTLP